MRVWNRELYTRAWKFAATAHRGQTVPGSDLPYIVHVGNVAMVVMTAIANSNDVAEPDLAVQCALLHDVIEDTEVSPEQLAELFGPEVAAGVTALTKNPELSGKAEKMADSLARIRAQPAQVWMVKMADRITNLQPPPSHWSVEKITAYREEAILIHQALHTANDYLSEQLKLAIDAYGPHMLGAGEPLGSNRSGKLQDTYRTTSLPEDFQLEYYWREGTVPPPHHYEYRIRLDTTGKGELLFQPDYPSEHPPEWIEIFTVTSLDLDRLYQQVIERKIVGRHWEPIPDIEAPLGGELESLEFVVNAQHYSIPSAIVDAARVDSIYRFIRSLIPETTWQSMMDRREAYIREQQGE